MSPLFILAIIAGGAFLLRGVVNESRPPYYSQIIDTASRHGVPSPLALAQIKKESGFNPGAVSSVGARGLMQVRAGALADVNASLGTSYTLADLFDPEINLVVGFKYLDLKREQYGSLYRAYVAYYAGHYPDADGQAYADSIFQTSQEY